MSDLWGIVVPIIVAVVLSVSGSWVIAKWSGPAQQAYVAAVESRLKIVTQERDDAWAKIPRLERRIEQLEAEVHELKEREVHLLRRLDADERRLPGGPGGSR